MNWSGNDSQAFFPNNGQKAQRGTAWLFNATLPVGNEVFGYIQVTGKHGLRDMLI